MDGYPVTTLSFADEKEMLIALGKLMVEWDPDIIEGYNSVAFDMVRDFASKITTDDLR